MWSALAAAGIPAPARRPPGPNLLLRPAPSGGVTSGSLDYRTSSVAPTLHLKCPKCSEQAKALKAGCKCTGMPTDCGMRPQPQARPVCLRLRPLWRQRLPTRVCGSWWCQTLAPVEVDWRKTGWSTRRRCRHLLSSTSIDQYLGSVAATAPLQASERADPRCPADAYLLVGLPAPSHASAH